MARLVSLEGKSTWEWKVIDITEEQIKDIKENFDGNVSEWMDENDIFFEMEVVRDKSNQNHYEIYFEDGDGGKIEIEGLKTSLE